MGQAEVASGGLWISSVLMKLRESGVHVGERAWRLRALVWEDRQMDPLAGGPVPSNPGSCVSGFSGGPRGVSWVEWLSGLCRDVLAEGGVQCKALTRLAGLPSEHSWSGTPVTSANPTYRP